MCFGRFVAASNIVHAENDRCHVYTASTTGVYHSNVYDTSIFSSFERGVRTYKCCYETSEYLMGIPLGVYGSSIDRVCSQYIDEIAAAAVARGIENPGKKTSEITLHMGISDWLIMILVTFGILIVVIAG